MSKSKLDKITRLEDQIQKLTNEKKQVIQEYKESERKKRTHRICKRGGMIESILPESKDFTDEFMNELLKYLLTSGFARKQIDGLNEKNDIPDKTTPVKSAPVTVSDSIEVNDEDDETDSTYV